MTSYILKHSEGKRTMTSLKVFLCLTLVIAAFEWVHSAGLLEDCSSDPCNDTVNHICDTETDLCKVKADGTATDCNSNDANCPNNAACTNQTCSCNPGTKGAAGLCKVIVGSTCSEESDCTGVSGSPTFQCVITKPCKKGTCGCPAGHFGWNCLTLGHDQTCDPADDKCDDTVGLACDSTSNKCACSVNGTSYIAAVSACTTLKIFGGACSAVGDCFTGTANNGACNNGACGCETGYLEDSSVTGAQSCRRPYVGEACNSTCQKYTFPTSSMAADSLEASQSTPTCSSSKCACDNGKSVRSIPKGREGCINACIATTTATAKATGGACASFNECGASGICLKCPGDSAGICYASPCVSGGNGAGMIVVNGMMLVSLILLAFIY